MKAEIAKTELVKWIQESEDTNQFCERSILADAILSLQKNPPDVENALSRLIQLTPSQGYVLVKPPKIALEIENRITTDPDVL